MSRKTVTATACHIAPWPNEKSSYGPRNMATFRIVTRKTITPSEFRAPPATSSRVTHPLGLRRPSSASGRPACRRAGLPWADHRRDRLPDRPGHHPCAQGEQAAGAALASPPQGRPLRFGPCLPRRGPGRGEGLAGASGPAHEPRSVPARKPGRQMSQPHPLTPCETQQFGGRRVTK